MGSSTSLGDGSLMSGSTSSSTGEIGAGGSTMAACITALRMGLKSGFSERGNPLQGPLIIDIPGGLLVLVP